MTNKNPVFPKMYLYEGDKKASYVGMILKIILLLNISFVFIYLGYNEATTITYIGIILYMILVPIIAGVSLYTAIKVNQLKPLLAIVFSISPGYAVGYFIHAAYILTESPTILIGIFTTIVILFCMIFINLIKPFREQNVLFKGCIAAFLGIAISMIGTLGLDYLAIEYSFDNLFVIIPIFSFFASLFYSVDFDQLFILVEAEAPKEKEWDLALGLLLTIVWVYIRVLVLFVQIFENARKRKKIS